jgi:hypothetical protein
VPEGEVPLSFDERFQGQYLRLARQERCALTHDLGDKRGAIGVPEHPLESLVFVEYAPSGDGLTGSRLLFRHYLGSQPVKTSILGRLKKIDHAHAKTLGDPLEALEGRVTEPSLHPADVCPVEA